MKQASCPLNTIYTSEKDVAKPNTILVAKCSTDKTCSKCGSLSDTTVIKRGVKYSLYCSDCGAYIKQASIEDRRYIYATRITPNKQASIKVNSNYEDSNKTMIPK